MNTRTFDGLYRYLADAEWNSDTLVHVKRAILEELIDADAPVVDVPDARKLAALRAALLILDNADEWDADVTVTVAESIRYA